MALTSPPAGPVDAARHRRPAILDHPIVARLSDPRLAPALAVGCLVAMTLLVFQRQLFGHWTFQWDFLGSFSTAPAFVAATIGHGHPLWWSPFVASGFPVDVNPQAEIFFPIWWVFGALGAPLNLTAVTIVQVAHVLFGAAGVLALCRARRLAWPWATAAAVAYLFFGGFYGQSEHADIFRGFAYLPWLLWTLTPPAEGRRWTRLAALPPLAWLIASGAYPGELVSFSIVGVVYLGVALRLSPRNVWRRQRAALALAAAACAAVSAAVLLPYLIAVHYNELDRIYQPTFAIRAADSFRPIDFLGLWLNPFAWHPDGSIFAWALPLPLVIGLACSTLTTVRRHIPLVAAGVLAVLLSTTPQIGPIGRAMVSIGVLFPSRYPNSDYKAMIAVAVVVLAAEAWAHIAAARTIRRWPVILVCCGFAVGTILAPSTYSPATRTVWLALVVIAATAALIIARPRRAWLVAALIALVAIDGVREVRDIRLKGGISSWLATPSSAAMFRANEADLAELPTELRFAPPSRPARIPPWAPVSEFPRGSTPDAAGWVAHGYHELDYTGPQTTALVDAEKSPIWMRLLQEPWHGFVFPCPNSGCPTSAVQLPPPRTWRPSPSVHTLSYGAGKIVYAVHLTRPAVMVENELAIRGWRSNTPRARIIDGGIPLRVWSLGPGTYTFAASYHESGRTLQLSAVGAALFGWFGSLFLLFRRRCFADASRPDPRPALPTG